MMSQSSLFRNSIINESYLFIFAFVSNVLLVRILGPEGNGTLVKYLAVANVLVALSSFNFENGINYFIPNYGIVNLKKVIVQILGISLLLTFAILIIVSRWSPDLIFATSTTINHQLFFIALFIIGVLALKTANAFMSGMLFFKAHRKISLRIGLLKTMVYGIAFVLIFCQILKFDSTAFGLTLYLFFLGISAMIIFQHLVKSKPHHSSNARLGFSSFIRFTFPIYISYNVLMLFQKLNFWIIDAKLDTELLGIYGLAFTLSGMPFIFTTALRKPLYPMLSKREVPASKFAWIFRVNTGGMFLLIIPLIFLAPAIIITIYGHEFSRAIYPFRILILATFINSIAHLFSSYNEIKGLVRLNIFAFLISLITLFFIGLSIVPIQGINGAAIAFLISSVISSFLIISLSFYYGKLPRDNYFFPSIQDFRRLLISIE